MRKMTGLVDVAKSLETVDYKHLFLAPIRSSMVSQIALFSLVVVSFGGISTLTFQKYLVKNHNAKVLSAQTQNKGEVLAATAPLKGFLSVNVPSNFNDNVILKKDLDVAGSATFRGTVTIDDTVIDAATLLGTNNITSLTGGSGISITTGATPTITNSGVVSLQGKTGTLTFEAGSGISIDGMKISSSVSTPNTFKTVTVGSDSFSAGSSTDTLELAAGTGITLTTDTTNKKVTITGSSVTASGWTDGGTSIYTTTISDNVGIGTTTPSYKLDVAGTLNTTGAVTFGSTLDVTGNTNLSNLSVVGNLNTPGAATVGGTLNVTGTSTLGTVSSGNTTASSLSSTGQTNLGANLQVTGAATVGGNLNVAGIASISGSQVIAPSATGDTSLTLRASPGVSGNILDVQDYSGNTSLFSITKDGSLVMSGASLSGPGLESTGAIHLTNAANSIVGTAIEGGWTMNSNTFTYRRSVTVTNTSGSTLPKNYQISITLSSTASNHVYSNSQTAAPYYDFRSAWDNSGSVTEIARNVSSFASGNVTYAFQLQSNISAGNSDTYYIYYSNSALSTIDSAYSSYTGNVQVENADALTNWASSDNSNYALTLDTNVKNEGTGSVKATGLIGVLGTLSTSGQGQMATALNKPAAISVTTLGTHYIYTLGGNNGSSDVTTVTKTTIDGSGNAGTPTAVSQNALPQTLSGLTTIAKSGSTPNGGTGADGTLDLSLGSASGGCNGDNFIWNAGNQSCSIVPGKIGPTLTFTPGGYASISFTNAAGNQVIIGFSSANSSIYDRTNNTVSAGPSLTTNPSHGANSFQNAAGNQVIVMGGNSSTTKIYDRTNNTVSAGPSLGANAGNGSHSFTNAAGNQVIVMGFASSTTKIYDRTNNTVSDGDSLGANASNGAHSFTNAAGNQVIVMGGNSSTTKIYDRTNNTVSAGPSLGANADTGAHSFTNADGNQVIVLAGGTTTTKIYDRTNNTVSAGPDLGIAASNSAFSFQDSDGNQVIVTGTAGITKIYNRTTNTVSNGHNLGVTPGTGASSFENAAGNEVIVLGEATFLGGRTLIYNPKSTFNFTSVNIPSGKTLTASGGAILTFNVTGNVAVAGNITLDNAGYYIGDGPGEGGNGGLSPNYDGGGGGGNGGAGGAGAGTNGGTAGSTYSTEDVGSGGGNSYDVGGYGGGGLKITSAGTITNSGTISANGQIGTQGGGGGSGGYVSLTASTITNTGTIRANGGNGAAGGTEVIDQGSLGSSTYYFGGGGGGGGGRIILTAESITQGTTTATKGNGGAAGGGYSQASDGNDGTVTNLSAGSSIYALGGINGATPQTTVYKSTIDTSNNIGAFSTTNQGQLPVALYNHTSHIASSSGNTFVYVIGGNNGSSDVTTVYKAAFSGGDIGTFATTGQGQLGTGLSLHSSVIASMSGTQTLYVLGGINGVTAQTAVLKSTIDASGNLGSFTAVGQTALPTAIYDASAVVVTIANTNYIYLVGGKNSAGNPVNTIYKGTIDDSGNVTSWTQAGTLPATLSGTSSVTAKTGTSNYLYVIGGNNVSPVDTVYRGLVNDMTNYTATKTLSSAVNLTNKNHIQFDTYSSITGRYMYFEISENGSSWTQCADNSDFTSGMFSVSTANTWETKTCDISGVADASKNAILYFRFRVGTTQNSTITQYFDNIYAYMNSGTVANSTLAGGAVMGASNLNLNAQGTGGVQLNYDAASGLAGTGGLRVYDGGIGLLFSVNSTGTASIAGGLTFTGASASAQMNMLNGQNLTFKSSVGGDAGLSTIATLLNSGQFGIGSSTPLGLLDVNGSSTGKSLVILNQTGNQNILSASTSGITKFVIRNDGSVGMGGVPVGFLDVNGAATGKALAILNETGGQNILTASASGTTKMVLTNAGLLGIGNSNPVGMLDVSGKVTGKALAMFNETGNQDILTASASGVTKMVLTNAGLMGIGTSAPTASLHIVGTSSTSPLTVIGGTAPNAADGVTGGAINLTAGTGGDGTEPTEQGNGGTGGAINITGGTGGDRYITGCGGGCVDGTGGNVVLTGGVPGGSTGAGGNVVLTGGAGGSSSVGGDVLLDGGTGGSIGDVLLGSVRGKIGIGTSAPVAKIDTLSNFGTVPIASFSGNTSFGGMVVNNNSIRGDLFTASSSGLTRFTIRNNGNVGIGDTLPNHLLTVKGQSNSSIIAYSGTAVAPFASYGTVIGAFDDGSGTNKFASVLLGQSLSDFGGMKWLYNATPANASLSMGTFSSQKLNLVTGATTALTIDTGQRVGIGTTSPTAKLDVLGNLGTVPIASFSGNTSFAGMVVNNNSTLGDLFTASSSGLKRFVIKNSGDVDLMGTASVSGNLVFDSAGSLQTTNRNTLNIGGDTTGNILFKPDGGGTTVGTFSSGGVGIFNPTPTVNLDVGNPGLLFGATVYRVAWNNGTHRGGLGVDSSMNNEIRIGAISNDGIEFVTNDDIKAYMTAAGLFGIGTTTPSARLQVGDQGDGSVAKANAWNVFSDVRFKENINPLQDALSKVVSLVGVSFNWKNSGESAIGFIAQDVEKILPEIVNTDANGFKSLDYGKITPLLVNAVHQQQEQIDTLNAKVDKLETINFLPFSSIATDSSMITIKDSLLVLGSTTTNDLSAANSITVGNNLNITGNSINTLGQDLELQSLKQGAISLMGGAVKIETDGTLKVSENAEFAKDVKVEGVLSTQTINIDSKTLPVYSSDTEVSVSGSAGLLVLKSGYNQLKVNDPKVTSKSLIFLTPKDNIDIPLFIKEQVDGKYFMVGVKSAPTTNIDFNFLIIN